jgi:putative salt-induced outer membrane protein YdiY
MKRNIVLAAVLAAFPLTSLAHGAAPATKEPVFKASAELGALYKTGNTKSGDIKTGFDANYDVGLWRNALTFDLLIRKSEKTNDDGSTDFTTSDQKWIVTAQTNYTIDIKSKNYVYGNVSHEDNRFANFETQSSISTGWGRRWLEENNATFDAEIGPGYKREVTRATDSTPSSIDTAFIVQAQGLYTRKLNEHVELKQILTAKIAPASGDNSNYKAETSITTKLIETLQLKFSFKIDYNTDVAAGRKNTDTETAVTLVYNF